MTWIPGSSPGMTHTKVYVEKTLFFCRHPGAGRGPLPRRDIFICTMTWIPGSSPGMTKGGGIRHYLHHDPDSRVRSRNDTCKSVCGKNSVFLPSPRRRPRNDTRNKPRNRKKSRWRNVTAGVLVFSCLGGIKNYAIITRIDIGKRDEKILFHFIRTDDWNCHHCVGSRCHGVMRQ